MNDEGTIKPYQMFFLMIGYFIGPGSLTMPSILIKSSKQDAWITALIGLIYPLSMIFLCYYIIKKVGSRDIIDITKDYMGKYLGSIIAFIFLFQNFIYIATITGDLITMSQAYVVGFLTPLKIALIGFGISIYTYSKGIQTLAKVTTIVVFFLFFLILLSIFSFKNLNLLNLQPILDTEIKDILTGTKDTFYFYIGAEILLFLNKYILPREHILRWSLYSILFSGIVWISCTLITLLFMGPDIASKSRWSFIYVYESLDIKVISNFMHIYIYIWSFIIFKSLSVYLFVGTEMLHSLTNFKRRNLIIALSPLLFFGYLTLYSQKYRVHFVDITSLFYVIFNYIYILSLILLIKLRGKGTKFIKRSMP